MKTTIKKYNEMTEIKSTLRAQEETFKQNDNWAQVFKIREVLEELEHTYFRKLDTVSVQYSIGGRQYYEEVVKIGKAFFKRGRKMTKSRGYWNTTEIPAITKEMNDSMLSDSYYY